MKKFIIILGVILTSGVAALALSSKHEDNSIKTAAQINVERNQLIKASASGQEFGTFKNNIASAD